MGFVQIIFYIFAGLAVVSALVMLFTKNVLYAAFALLLTLLGVAATYVFAAADFIAVTQLMVYVGGVLVLMVFGVMLTNRLSDQAIVSGSHNKLIGYLLGLSLFILLSYAILKVNFAALDWIQQAKATHEPISSTITPLGIRIMTDFVLPFEVVAILLLLALIGAVFIARGGRRNERMSD
jgi:NADH:ubiquinone oxidoreductase subunit 6 (subunit J)